MNLLGVALPKCRQLQPRTGRRFPGDTWRPGIVPVVKHPVTVVIPTRDRPELLVDALVSVKAAAARVAVSAEVEIIVVDNSSNDAITEQVRALTQIQGVRFLASSPAGLSRARNTGWKAGTGEFVTFLDDDDAYLPNYFQTLLAVFDANPSAGAAFGQMQMCDHRLDNPSTYAYPAGPMPSGEGLRYMLGTIVQQNAVMFRRTALADIGGYDETILTSEDWDIMMQLAAKHDVFGVEVPVCLIRQHAGLRMTNHMTYPQWVQYQRNCALVERTARTIKGRVPIAWRTRRFGFSCTVNRPTTPSRSHLRLERPARYTTPDASSAARFVARRSIPSNWSYSIDGKLSTFFGAENTPLLVDARAQAAALCCGISRDSCVLHGGSIGYRCAKLMATDGQFH